MNIFNKEKTLSENTKRVQIKQGNARIFGEAFIVKVEATLVNGCYKVIFLKDNELINNISFLVGQMT